MPVVIRRPGAEPEVWEGGVRLDDGPAEAPRQAAQVPTCYGRGFITGKGHEHVHEWDICHALAAIWFAERTERSRDRYNRRHAGTLDGDASEGVRADRDGLAGSRSRR